MKVLWYCPKCKRTEIKDEIPIKDFVAKGDLDKIRTNYQTLENSVEENGLKLNYYKCECGHSRACSVYNINFRDELDIEECKELIKNYQLFA